MYNREVSNVEIVLDKSSKSFSNITDRYLRNTLIRNKNREGIHSIIQTIQEKQDNIIALSKDDNFIVQGCAGSGKTMILLHRLKYLLYNAMIRKEDFVFLVPSNNFKQFIEGAADEFNIKSKSIISVQNYYQKLSGESILSEVDSNELLFDAKYLERVYSKDFIKEAYDELLEQIDIQTAKLIEICEDRLDLIIKKEYLEIDDKIDKCEKYVFENIYQVVGSLVNFIDVKISDFEDIPHFVDELKNKYEECKEAIDDVKIIEEEIVIKEDDKRILENKELSRLRSDIEGEEEAVKKASLFTVRGHKNKLNKLKEIYEYKYHELEKKLIEEDKKELEKNAITATIVFDDFTISDVEKIIQEVENIYISVKSELDRLNERKYNFEEDIENRFKAQIEITNEIIEESAEINLDAEKLVENLFPAVDFFSKYIKSARALIKIFNKYFLDDDLQSISENCKLFTERSKAMLEAYLHRILFNICKRKVKDEFNIAISKEYKHYWYLSLYCRYLTRNINNNRYSYIFIDEGQDLSVSELELIYKLNSTLSADKSGYLINPVLNIFGDTNQMIMEHGIKQWEEVSFINDKYELNENFRNPNQVVQFCNDRLPYKMEMIGIDMEAVDEYDQVEDAILNRKSINTNAIFIVKDDYAREDLKLELENKSIKDYEIYTVKEAKGLEYKEIFVCNRDMTDNEMYIAYTRAVKKLNVINNLENRVDLNKPLFIEGEDDDNEDIL